MKTTGYIVIGLAAFVWYIGGMPPYGFLVLICWAILGIGSWFLRMGEKK